MNYADRETESILHKLEKRIVSVYTKAGEEMREKADKHIKRYAQQIEKKRADVMAGKMSLAEFRLWQRQTLMVGERWEALKKTTANRISNANKVAAAYVNDTTPNIFSLNQNYMACAMEKAYTGISFAFINEQTVKRLLTGENHVNFRTLKIDPERDYKWNSKLITDALARGIIQGKSIPDLAKSFLDVMGRNRSAAIRNARTAVTSAQNGGRQETFERAHDMGIIVEKKWIATLDSRTRDSHLAMNGEVVKYNETFSNGLMYPADPSGVPAEVYNCRCVMVIDDDIKFKKMPTRPEYLEWARKKLNGK